MERSVRTRAFFQVVSLALFFSYSLDSHSVVLTVDNVSNFRESRLNAPVGFAQGDNLGIDVNLVGASASTLVTASNSVSGDVLMIPHNGGENFFLWVPYSAARAQGEWNVMAVDGVDILNFTIPALGTGIGTGPMPFIDNLIVTNIGPTPTISWAVPAGLPSENDGNVDRFRVRVVGLNGASVLDDRLAFGDLSITSYTVGTDTGPRCAGACDELPPGDYFIRFFIEGFGIDPPFNFPPEVFVRSATFSTQFEVQSVPEPMTILLLGLGSAGLAFARKQLH